MNKTYDLIILGAGPAGITSSVYASNKQLDFLVLTEDIGGQAALSGDVENYTGYQFISGPELALKFEKHMESFHIPVEMPQTATDITMQDQLIKTVTDKAEYFSRTLIIATGKHPRLLHVEGEKEFRNKGVTYCATCDGPLFKNKNVAVIGGGNSGLDAALLMMQICPQVHIVNISEDLTGDPVMQDKLKEADNVKIWNNASVKKVFGETFVKGIEIEQKSALHRLDVEGVFVEIGLTPNSDFAHILEKNNKQEIKVDSRNRTSVNGVFAAGDVTDVPEKQIIIACGEGSKACLSAFHYLSTNKF